MLYRLDILFVHTFKNSCAYLNPNTMYYLRRVSGTQIKITIFFFLYEHQLTFHCLFVMEEIILTVNLKKWLLAWQLPPPQKKNSLILQMMTCKISLFMKWFFFCDLVG
jgi:hypothetical protein